MRPNVKARPRRQAFTLMELLLVVLIISILMGIVLGFTGYASRAAARSRALADIQKIKDALEQYRLANGTYPTVSGDMTAAPWAPFRAALTNYVRDLNFTDPWGRGYRFESQGRFQFKLWSYGPDTNNLETRVEQL